MIQFSKKKNKRNKSKKSNKYNNNYMLKKKNKLSLKIQMLIPNRKKSNSTFILK
jgi:hypothetical protein